jgi:hypothetical protein
MTDEERQRQIDFILNTQAIHEKEIGDIRKDLQLYVDQNIVLQRAVVAMIEKENQLSDAMKELTERVNAFILTAERHISDGKRHKD